MIPSKLIIDYGRKGRVEEFTLDASSVPEALEKAGKKFKLAVKSIGCEPTVTATFLQELDGEPTREGLFWLVYVNDVEATKPVDQITLQKSDTVKLKLKPVGFGRSRPP